jgi:HJR/Mrr/RecB family endonuclease
MLKVLKVYRYRSSGRLIASGLGNGYVFPLNSDLSFSSKEPHRVHRHTQFDLTPYRIEVEVVAQGKQNAYRIIRTWNENHLPPKSSNPNAPIEHRIDVSPSQDLNEAEKQYVGQSSGHPIGFSLMGGSFFLLWMVGLWGWLPPLVAFAAGIIVVYLTKTPGDSSKILEVNEAKKRLRQESEIKLRESMLDVRVWAALDGVGFENAVARIFREQGFDVEFTPWTNDQGVDLILRKSGTVSIVQCKAYKNNVGISAVRELIGVRASWPNAAEAILATLFDFSKAAKTFAAEHNIKLFSVARDYLKTDYRPGS